jgi:hypothetical protein
MKRSLADAVRRALQQGRSLGPGDTPISLERITRILSGAGLVEVLGAQIPVAGDGLRALRPGMRAAVAWQQGRPVVAIAHSVRRNGAPNPPPRPVGGIVEELFIATDPSTMARQVWFRNDQQVTNLDLRRLLPGDPVAVRWGADTRSFVVRVGGPAGAIDFTGEVTNPPQNQTYHAFELVDANPGQILGATTAAAKLLASYSPSTSTLEVMAYTAEYAGSTFSRHLKTEFMATEIDPPPIGEHDPIPQCVPSAFSVSDFADTSLLESGSTDRVAVTLGELLLQQVLESFDTPFGPSAIVDFGLDADRHLLLAVRARKRVEVLVPTTIVGEVQEAVAGECGWTGEGQPPGSQGVAVRDGEAHAWVIDLTAGAIRFRTNQVEAALKVQLGTSSADVVGIEGLAQTLEDPTGCFPASCGLAIHGLIMPPDNPDPSVFYPVGAALEYGTLPAPVIDPHDWRDLWDEARFAFITETLARSGTVTPIARSAALFIGLAILEYAEPYNPFGVESQLITWSSPTPTLPDPPPVYHVTDLRILATPMDAVHPMLLFISVLRRKNNATHEYSAHIVTADGTIVRTLKDWTAMVSAVGVGPVMSEIDADEFHDGGRVAFLSGNFEHVLWEYSTAPERDAGIRHVMLTQLSTGGSIEVGTNWAEFAGHDFRVLNLDVLYSAKEDEATGRRFVVGWVADTGKADTGNPTLSQSAKGYPVDDEDLAPVQTLAELETGTPPPTVRDLQAVNDIDALSQTGRELRPEIP